MSEDKIMKAKKNESKNGINFVFGPFMIIDQRFFFSENVQESYGSFNFSYHNEAQRIKNRRNEASHHQNSDVSRYGFMEIEIFPHF